MTLREQPTAPVPPELDELAGRVTDAVYAVHRHLGPGLLEVVYTRCLVHELGKRGLAVEEQVRVPIEYDGRTFDVDLRLDLLVEGELLVDLVPGGELGPLQTSRMLTLLKLTGHRLGLVVSFDVVKIRRGVRRVAW